MDEQTPQERLEEIAKQLGSCSCRACRIKAIREFAKVFAELLDDRGCPECANEILSSVKDLK